MNGITLALIRFWQNKQISLPPMSTLLIAAGIMFFCFWVVTSQKQKEQEERAKARKNVFQNLDAAIAAAPICEHIPCRTNPAKFYFLGVQTGIISEQEDAGILCSYLTHWMQTGAVTWQNCRQEQHPVNKLCGMHFVHWLGRNEPQPENNCSSGASVGNTVVFSGTAERAAVLCMNGI